MNDQSNWREQLYKLLREEDGRIVEQGTYDELMEMDGEFAALAKRQLA